MITDIKHKGLKKYWLSGDSSKLPSNMVTKIEVVMSIIDQIEQLPEDLYPMTNLDPHKLVGDYKGYRSLKVLKNWKTIFLFDNQTKTAAGVEFIDYH